MIFVNNMRFEVPGIGIYIVHEHGEISDTQGEIATVGKTRTPVQGNPAFSNGVVSTKQILESVSKTENFGSTSKNME